MTQTLQETSVLTADGVDRPYVLLPKDRSDCCGVEALYKVTLSEDLTPLLFCGHHFAKHKNSFPSGVTILDESSKLG